MRVLLDTHVLLWALDDPERLGRRVCGELEDPANEVMFSAASIWEIAIKSRWGRADFQFDARQIAQVARETGLLEQPIGAEVAARVAALPPHHQDPFDRLLIAQAMHAPARFYTADSELRRYSELVALVP